jgi:hypothetical protein
MVISYFYAVMLMGTLVYGIRYTLPEYLCTFLVAGGVSTFALLKVMIIPMLKTTIFFLLKFFMLSF